jgi:hypothetical protein
MNAFVLSVAAIIVVLGTPTSISQPPGSNVALKRGYDCPPCWDGTRSGCKPKSYITKQYSDTAVSLYYTCTFEDGLTTYYIWNNGCSGDGICDNGQLYEYYEYKVVVPGDELSGCGWAA